MQYSTSRLYFLDTHKSLRVSVYTEKKTSDKWDVPRHNTRERSITIFAMP